MQLNSTKPFDVHVVCGEHSHNTLVASEILDQENTKIVVLSGSLNEGPLVGLEDSEAAVKARAEWFLNINNGIDIDRQDEEYRAHLEDITALKLILEYVKQGHRTYLWTGSVASEVMAIARLCYYIPNYYPYLFKADFPHIPTTNSRGETIYAESLYLTRVPEVKKILDHFKVLREEDFLCFQEMGHQLMNGKGTLRIVHKDGSLEEVAEDYFDRALLSNCHSEFLKSALVVAYTLIQIDFAVGDCFLASRLIEMAKSEQIDYRGELKAMKDFEVKLIL